MKSMYKKGGKSTKTKDSWMEENSNEINFGKPTKKMSMGGPKSERVDARANKKMDKAKATWQRAEAIKNYDETEEGVNFAQDEFGMNASRKANQLYAKAERQENKAEKLKKRAEFLKASGKKTGGAKSMEPGGGGRFAKMVSGLKKKGKSEESAKAIAASIGRKKYGKSRFQEMAAAGKKKMGGKKC
jgi:hypothetical protein